MHSKAKKNDIDIILRLKNGDQTAFTIIYNRSYDQVYSFIFSFLKDQQSSEEVLQETFLAIWLQRGTLDPNVPLEPLLFTICRRKVLSSFRKTTSTQSLKELLIHRMSELVNDTEDTVLYRDMLNFTHEAIKLLSKQQQVVFKLSRIDGLSFDEIASQLNLSRNTVKNHLVSALRTLRVHFENKGMYHLYLILPLCIQIGNCISG